MKTISKSLLATTLLLISAMIFGQVVKPIDKDKIANGGYDMVAYFKDNAAVKGKKEFTQELNGVKYQFASQEHQILFKSDPAKYLPVCDGYCAWGVVEKVSVANFNADLMPDHQ
ncbi:MAG TPA: YHS domain-containing (seleno)protein [Chryseolinea sp.]